MRDGGQSGLLATAAHQNYASLPRIALRARHTPLSVTAGGGLLLGFRGLDDDEPNCV